MQLNLTTDYAIRTILYLAQKNDIASAPEIGEAVAVSENYLMKVLHRLKETGIVDGRQGKNGGYSLKKAPVDISLWDIMNIMETEMTFNRCLEPDEFCGRGATATCPVRKYYIKVQKTVEDILTSVTVEKLLRESDEEVIEKDKKLLTNP